MHSVFIQDNPELSVFAADITLTRTSVHAALTCDWVLASMALLGHISLEAVHAVNTVFMGSEASSRQRFTACFAHETLRVPGLVLVADPSRGDGLRGTENILMMVSHTIKIEYNPFC